METREQYLSFGTKVYGIMNFKCQKKLIEQKVRVYMSPTVVTEMDQPNFYLPVQKITHLGTEVLQLWSSDFQY